jgi:hypothetical protein
MSRLSRKIENMHAEFITEAESGRYHESLTASGDGFGSHVVACVGITNGDSLLTRVDIVASAGGSCFQSLRTKGDHVYIGYGQHIFVVDVKLNQIVSFSLDGYFGHLYDSGDLENLDCRISVIATSASEVLTFGPAGDLLWKKSGLGIDGVVIHSVNAGRVEGEGEFDPPGGWQPFTLIEESGEIHW